jgi:hypothetical protein
MIYRRYYHAGVAVSRHGQLARGWLGLSRKATLIKAYLDSIQWRGFLNVELGTSPWRPPQESARITANYIQNVLKIRL